MNQKITRLTITALFAALIVVATFIKIPLSLVPITMQFPVVCLTGLLLGSYWGSLSVLTFIVLGLIGLPVFAGGGGISYVLSPTFGYIYGFLVGVYISGKLLKNQVEVKLPRLLTAGAINLIIVYVFGALHLVLIKIFYLGNATDVNFMWVIKTGFGLFFIKDVVMVVIAALLATRLRPILFKHADFS